MKLRFLISVAVLIVGGALAMSVAAAVDPGTRTVAVGPFQVQWSQTNPEEILRLSWNGSTNLTKIGRAHV